MQTWIVLLRGINVGGNNIIKMADLRKLLEGLGYQNVKTYIQSGNVVLQSDAASAVDVSSQIEAAIEDRFGFRPRIYVMGLDDFEAIHEANPYRNEGEQNPKSVHYFLLMESEKAPAKNLPSLEELKAEDESYFQTDRCFYLHAPNGIGRSKLADKVDRSLGKSTTARNYKTVLKLLEMAGSI
jgi:uncharacterized protein (DUF1697 family)